MLNEHEHNLSSSNSSQDIFATASDESTGHSTSSVDGESKVNESSTTDNLEEQLRTEDFNSRNAISTPLQTSYERRHFVGKITKTQSTSKGHRFISQVNRSKVVSRA
ncbi:hypothetical protein CEXT_770181 [Caerostris extrusa]|uniref:Uncharacterized protein n=1 Tax=Caerostris extrusa TaxID=172846 RepID=A0AAV4PDK4_CAEEX|nr:hypothetical protein CEXT_770181 [Caerostris extrusa]